MSSSAELKADSPVQIRPAAFKHKDNFQTSLENFGVYKNWNWQRSQPLDMHLGTDNNFWTRELLRVEEFLWTSS